jgi:hypothetical protein
MMDDMLKRAAEHIAVALVLAWYACSDEGLRRGLGKAARWHWQRGWRLAAIWLRQTGIGVPVPQGG